MQKELNLTDKQYKKVLKVYQQEEDALFSNGESSSNMQGGFGGPGMGGPGMGPGGMNGGMGRPDGAPQMGEGTQGRPEGAPEMKEGAEGKTEGAQVKEGTEDRPEGAPQMRGNRPENFPEINIGDDVTGKKIQKVLAKKEKKLRKILTPEQFEQWSTSHPREFHR